MGGLSLSRLEHLSLQDMNSTVLSQFARGVGEWFGFPGPLVGALVIALLVAWTCWRTRSTHLFITRMWRLVAGKQDFSDREIGRFLEQRHKLLKFRFHSGLAVRTLPQAKRMVAWSSKHDEELSDVQACGNLFDIEECRLREERLPGSWHQFWSGIAMVLLIWALVFLAGGAAATRAILQMKESGTWLTVSSDSVRGLFDGEVVTTKDCTQGSGGVASKLGVTALEASSICDALADPATAQFVASSVRGQRAAFGTLTLSALFLWIMLLRSMRRGFAAKEMQKRLRRKASGLRAAAEECEEQEPALPTSQESTPRVPAELSCG